MSDAAAPAEQTFRQPASENRYDAARTPLPLHPQLPVPLPLPIPVGLVPQVQPPSLC